MKKAWKLIGFSIFIATFAYFFDYTLLWLMAFILLRSFLLLILNGF